jgi:hypothetical protein
MNPGRRQLAVITLLAISPFSWAALLSGQFTPFVLLGVVGSFAWPGVAGPLLLLSLKPHLGILPALLLLIRRFRLRRWSELGRELLLFALVAASGFLVVPGSTSFLRRMAYGNVYALEPQFMASTLELLERLGLDPRLAIPLYILFALGLFLLLLFRDSLPLTAAAVLLAAPYARNYDYGFVLVPALYLVHRRFALGAVILLLLWPLYRLFVGDLSWTWTDIVVPITLMAFLLIEESRGLSGTEPRR